MAEPFRHVDLCSGIGGFALGFQWAGLSEPVLFCDIEAWSRRVLAKHWPDVPIADDVKELASDPARLVPDCDILSCGYPCQPFSQAGVRRGEEDDRHIWPEIFTIIEAKRPRWVVCENVAGHLSLGLNTVLSDLADKAGYEVQTFCLGAVALNAPHRRQRIWIIAAHADSESQSDVTGHGEEGQWLGYACHVGHADGGDCSRHNKATDQGWRQQGLATGCEDVADTASGRSQEHGHGGAEDAVQRGKALADASCELSHRGRQSGPSRRGQHTDSGQDVADADSSGEGRGLPSLAGADAEKDRPKIEHQDQAIRFRDSGQDGAKCGNERPATAVSKPQSELGRMVDGLPTWLDEPRDIPRVATGVKQRAARLKGLGNAIVPQIAMQIGLTIKAVEHG